MYIKRIRDLREDNDLKQVNIAQFLNMKQPQYALYESGKRDFPIDCIIKLANFYHTSTDYLLGLTNEPKPYPKIKYKKKSDS